MANKSISQLDSAVAVTNEDLFETAIPDQGSATGYASKKHSMAVMANHIGTAVSYPALSTTAKTLVNAINEAAQAGGTTVVANPSGAATDTLNKIQIESTIYDIEGSGGGGSAIDYVEYTITSLTNGTIDTSRGGCWYSKYGNIIHLHLSVKDLTAETTTSVFTMPSGLRPPHGLAMGIGIGAARDNRASVSIGASTGVCNLWSESTTAVIDVEWMIDAEGGSGSGDVYSTTEHVVGKWIDGNPVYEKTIMLENVNYSSINTNYTVMTIPDLAVPISLTALFSNSGKTIYHSSPYVATDAQAKKTYFDFDMTNKLIFFISQDTWGSTNMIVTARYTKTV